MNSAISIIIPAYNRASLIGATLRSLLAQSVPANEIIVVDDGSTDCTAEVAGSFGDPVRVIRQANAGPAVARNHGFRESSSEFIQFFDSDDLAITSQLESQLESLQRSGADIAYSPWIKGQIEPSGFQPSDHVFQQWGMPNKNLIRALLTDWSIIPHACLFRRSIVQRVGGFPEDLKVAEDQLMFLRCLLAGGRVVHTPNALVLYRIGNIGKLSADPATLRYRLRDWGRFLERADRDCAADGIAARKWFGFRRRAWQAAEDLVGVGAEEDELNSSLYKIAGAPINYSLYSWHRTMQQKQQGLKQRIFGGRSLRSFRSGPLNPCQRARIAELFEAYVKSGDQTRSSIQHTVD